MNFEQALSQAKLQAAKKDSIHFVYIDRKNDSGFHWCTVWEFQHGSCQLANDEDVLACVYPNGEVEFFND